MSTSPAELVAAALAGAGTPVDTAMAERIASRLSTQTVVDAAKFGRLVVMATQTLDTIRSEPAAPIPVSREDHAKAYMRDKGWDKALGVKKLELWDAALHAVDKMAAGAVSHEAAAIADVAAKHPVHITAQDALHVANAKLADSGNRPVVGTPLVPSSALPSGDSSAPLNPSAKLRYANRLSGESLRLYREFSQISAKVATMSPGIDKLKAVEYSTNLARSLQLHGVVVEPPA